MLKILDIFGKNEREADVTDVPDIVPILSAVASVKTGVTTFTGTNRLRLKECDRVRAIAELINSLGGNVTYNSDSITIVGKEKLKGGTVSSQGDHRIAMTAAILATVCEEEIIIKDAEAVQKSYPNFFEDFRKLGGNAVEQ
jgi:3-phosphoshikimate 1-carboxyvinyltransferase